MVATIRQGIPAGMFRVAGCDLFDGSDYLVKDCNTKDEAFWITDDHNRMRSGGLSDTYYVYDSQGNCIRDETDVKSVEIASRDQVRYLSLLRSFSGND